MVEGKIEMLTATGHRHVVRALKTALRIRESHARHIMESMRNQWLLDMIEGDMRSARFVVSSGSNNGRRDMATLYVDAGRGYDATPLWLMLDPEDMVRWNALALEDAYEIAAEIEAGRSQDAIDADDRLAAEAANDDFPDLDAIYGPVTWETPRPYEWIDGKVLRADVASAGDHVVTLVELAGGERRAMAMFPLFSDVADLLKYATGKVGVRARLCVERVTAFDDDVPPGFDRSMPVLSMVMRERDLPSVTGLRRAA